MAGAFFGCQALGVQTPMCRMLLNSECLGTSLDLPVFPFPYHHEQANNTD